MILLSDINNNNCHYDLKLKDFLRSIDLYGSIIRDVLMSFLLKTKIGLAYIIVMLAFNAISDGEREVRV